MENKDKDFVELIETLNELPHVKVFSSFCGDLKQPYRIWFRCNDFARLAKLYRCVNRNYSDGKWRIEISGTDECPLYAFMLESKEVFSTSAEMAQSVQQLISSIKYWEQKRFEEHFNPTNYEYIWNRKLT